MRPSSQWWSWLARYHMIFNTRICISYYTPVSQTRWDPHTTGKISPKFVPSRRQPLKLRPHWENWRITIPTVNFWSGFAVPTAFYGLKTMKMNIPSYKIKGIFNPHLEICSKFYPHWLWDFHRVTETGVSYWVSIDHRATNIC